MPRLSHSTTRPSKPAASQNGLLHALSRRDRALLEPHLIHMVLEKGDVLTHVHQPIEQVYFPASALASVVALTRRDRQIEVGLFGHDGMSGTSIVLGSDRSPHETFIQIAGRASQITVEHFRHALQQSPSLVALLLRYVEAFNIQVAHTAVANGVYTLEERLARWLLMCHDRIQGNDLPLVHEFLSMMLAVRRAGVSEALYALEGAGMITAARGRISIVSRARLEEAAGGSYGQPEAEYRRLVGPF
jgi:CRP-like cAMP-binding protein